MVPLLAWRNIWRNPTRSSIVILAIAIGIWAHLFLMGFATGMVQSYIEQNIAHVVAHLQIHSPDYLRDREVHDYLQDAPALRRTLDIHPGVRGHSARTLASGMISAAKGSRGVLIKGINPEQEARVSALPESMQEGTYFESDRSNQILLGVALAEKLQVKLRSKVVLTFQDMEGNITTGAFRVAGIFASGNTPFEEGHVFVRQQDLSALLVGSPTENPLIPIHEIAIISTSTQEMIPLQQTLQQTFPNIQVENYREIAPELRLYESQIDLVSLIYLTIIMLALVFGIINTMLMAVLERFRELGMLMAIGMNKGKVFLMIVLETLMLSVMGAPIGLLLGGLTIRYFGVHGMDLSKFAKSLHEYGMETTVYFVAEKNIFWQSPIFLLLTALIASIYPALKAIRMKPVEAIRKT